MRYVRASVTSGDFSPALITVPNIEILEVGEDWETSTGIFTWTEEDLQSAIASLDDPAIRTPVVKLGHADPRFDGQPSFGRLGNLRVSANQQTLIADLLGVPQWLAHIMPSAYPRRSIEGWFEFETRTDHKWPFVLTAMALLGDAYPAIVTLEDLKVLWGGVAPPLYPVDDIEELEEQYVAASRPVGFVAARKVVELPNWLHRKTEAREVSAAAAASEVKATTSTSDVQRAFYDSLEGPMSWWWIRSVLVNPFQLVVDDDKGGLYLVDVTVDASDNITFGEPQAVKVEYVAAVANNLANVRKAGQVMASSFGDRVAAGAKPKEDGEKDTSSDPSDSEEERDVQLNDDALRALGLEPGATDEQINAAILARAQGDGNGEGGEGDGNDQSQPPQTPATAPAGQPATTPAAPTPTPAGDGNGEGDGAGSGTTDTTTPSAPQVPDGMVLVDQAQWSEVAQEVAASRADRTHRAEQERDAFLESAVKAGKFPRTRIAHYTGLWNLDPQGTKAAIAAIPDGLIPVTENGHQGGTDVEVDAAYPDSWKRDPHVVRARNSVSTRLKVVND